MIHLGASHRPQLAASLGRGWLAFALLVLLLFAQLCHVTQHIACSTPSVSETCGQPVAHDSGLDVQDSCLLCLLLQGIDVTDPAPLAVPPPAEAFFEQPTSPRLGVATLTPTRHVRGPPTSG